MFLSKARTLAALIGRLRNGSVEPLEIVPVARWRDQRQQVLADVRARSWPRMAVRSSAACEDRAAASMAGAFLTRLHVTPETLAEALDAVAASMAEGGRTSPGADVGAGADLGGGQGAGEDEIFVQPMVEDTVLAGVAFSRDPNSGGPYFVINYEQGGGTDGVTSGGAEAVRTWFVHHAAPAPPDHLSRVVALLQELEAHFPGAALDVEFALRSDGAVALLQVRPLALPMGSVAAERHAPWISRIAAKVEQGQTPHPFLFGSRTVFGVMPDWNPAEIIGVRPRPLALTLYKDLVTDAIWAYQRDNYGYRNLRSFPLLQSLLGLPYIDVRVSFNSFLPKDLPDDLAQALVDYYIRELIAHPTRHDKVEFDIVFTCYSFDLSQRFEPLAQAGFSRHDLEILGDALRRLTHRIIHHGQGLWRQDRAKLDTLIERHRTVMASALDPIGKIYWLLEDCKRYGTLPFAGLARAGFIAAQILRSLVAVGVLSEAEREQFMRSLDTVSGQMGCDFTRLSRFAFLEKYGHLRPGTYDITSFRYDEAPELYFDWQAAAGPPPEENRAFRLDLNQFRAIETLLREHGLNDSVLGLFEFLKAAIEGREYAKFVFSRSLSDALKVMVEWGRSLGFDRDALSFLDIATLRHLASEAEDGREAIARSIEAGRQTYARTQSIVLPPLITDPAQAWSFALPAAAPNFITQKRVTAATATVAAGREQLKRHLVLIPAADPGYDWLFTCGIAGFITQYGGVNSHMAIRAQELGLPAVIGCGEALYGRWRRARRLEIDCANRQVRVLS